MAWIQITVGTNQDLAEIYSEYFTLAGAVAVTLHDAKDDPLFEPAPNTTPLWQETTLVGLFDAHADMVSVKKFLKTHLDSQTLQTLKIDPLEEKDWIRAGIAQWQPMRFGKKLMICPSWSENPDPTATTLMLDPGLAFGTGTHATTRLCLEWLDQYLPMGGTVVDYGCGSGILGIAALKLGAQFVYAVDNDPQALLSTQNNAKNNGFAEKNILTLLPAELNPALKGSITTPKKASLILANILANPLITLAPTFAELIEKGGIIVLSGFLENQIESVFEAYKPWFKLLETDTIDGWVRLSAKTL
jgi:ribosomal protein L11 methyltransferase